MYPWNFIFFCFNYTAVSIFYLHNLLLWPMVTTIVLNRQQNILEEMGFLNKYIKNMYGRLSIKLCSSMHVANVMTFVATTQNGWFSEHHDVKCSSLKYASILDLL